MFALIIGTIQPTYSQAPLFFTLLETITVLIFKVEYVLRLSSCTSDPVFIADPGQIEVLTDSFGLAGSSGYSTDLDRPANQRHPHFAGYGLELPGNGEVDGASGQTQPLLVRCADVRVGHLEKARRVTHSGICPADAPSGSIFANVLCGPRSANRQIRQHSVGDMVEHHYIDHGR